MPRGELGDTFAVPLPRFLRRVPCPHRRWAGGTGGLHAAHSATDQGVTKDLGEMRGELVGVEDAG